MKLHQIQEKILKITDQINFKKMSLRDIGLLVDESHPQKISHHIGQLVKKGYIEIDKKTGIVKLVNHKIRNMESDIMAVPIYGSANCGEANIFAEENLEGYVRVSKRFTRGVKNIFAIRAIGPSMNQAKINKQYSIEEGDLVLIDSGNKNPENGDYVLSVINGCANIKKFLWNKKERQIALVSESSENIAPIYIHADDNYMINGLVKNVIKNSFFKEMEMMQSVSASDVLRNLGSISREEVNYYENL